MEAIIKAVISSGGPGSGEQLGRSFDRLIGMLVSSAVTITLAAVALKHLTADSNTNDNNNNNNNKESPEAFFQRLFAAIIRGYAMATKAGKGASPTSSPKFGDDYYKKAYNNAAGSSDDATVTHRGSCHCSAVQFTLLAPAKPHAYDCPSKIRYPHIPASSNTFHLTRGTKHLKLYYVTLTKTSDRCLAAHGFCANCGVHVFRAPNPEKDVIEVNINCIDGNTAAGASVEFYDKEVATAMGAGTAVQDHFNLNREGGDEKPVMDVQSVHSVSPTANALVAFNVGSSNTGNPSPLGMSPSASVASISPRKVAAVRLDLSNDLSSAASGGGSASVASGNSSSYASSSNHLRSLNCSIDNAYPFNQPLDTPMKNQMHYHLGKHLSRPGEENYPPNHTPVHPMAKSWRGKSSSL